ncbi:MAG: PrsW family intramembrane metalloprotease [Caldilineaceae bacterium]|nr:PrsW family intramembrane metalloprotease [Caldilineaceae bacterium]
MQTTYSGGDELSRVERVAHNRSGLWVAIVITLVSLLVFTGIFNFILPDFGDNLSGVSLMLVGVIFSLIPAFIWLYFFYRLDRLEAEPKTLVLSVFVIGALATGALHDFIINDIFNVSSWQYNSWWGHLLGGILIVGFVEQAIIYATVRFTVFRHPEFDERVDGVIYSVAAGLGLATVLNFYYVFRSNGVDLDIGSIRMVINTLAYASFAGIMGYFIGQARFEKTPIWYMPAGLTLAAVFNGLFWYLLDRTFGGGLSYNPWGDLILAAIIAVISLAVVFWLIERANEETLRLAHRTIRDGIVTTPPMPVPVPATPPAATSATSTSTPEAPAAQDSQENA